jgi:Domain of unknown function (DUF6456)
MAKQRRDKTRAARRRAERERINAAAREAGAEAAEEALTRPRHARHVARLDELLARKVITPEQAQAGARLERDFRASNSVIGGRLIGVYEANQPRPPKKFQMPPPDAPHVIEARERVERAFAALGPLAPIVVHVVICDLPASSWGANGKPNTDAPGLLRFALSVLAVHFSTATAAWAVPARRSSSPAASRLSGQLALSGAA